MNNIKYVDDITMNITQLCVMFYWISAIVLVVVPTLLHIITFQW